LGDRGEHRESQAQTLTEAGCEVELAASAAAALEALSKRRHRLVISNLGGGAERSAGWLLLSKLPTSPPAPGSQTLPWVPLIFFTSESVAAEYREEALRKGALACTAGTVSLFEAVLHVLRA